MHTLHTKSKHLTSEKRKNYSIFNFVVYNIGFLNVKTAQKMCMFVESSAPMFD